MITKIFTNKIFLVVAVIVIAIIIIALSINPKPIKPIANDTIPIAVIDTAKLRTYNSELYDKINSTKKWRKSYYVNTKYEIGQFCENGLINNKQAEDFYVFLDIANLLLLTDTVRRFCINAQDTNSLYVLKTAVYSIENTKILRDSIDAYDYFYDLACNIDYYTMNQKYDSSKTKEYREQVGSFSSYKILTKNKYLNDEISKCNNKFNIQIKDDSSYSKSSDTNYLKYLSLNDIRNSFYKKRITALKKAHRYE